MISFGSLLVVNTAGRFKRQHVPFPENTLSVWRRNVCSWLRFEGVAKHRDQAPSPRRVQEAGIARQVVEVALDGIDRDPPRSPSTYALRAGSRC